MQKLLYITSLFVALTLFGACNQNGRNSSDNDSTALKLGVLPTMECLPFYYADSIGLFDSLDVQVKLVTFDAAMDADTAFTNGAIDGIVSDLVKACVWQGNGDSMQVAMVGDLRLWLITAQNARLLKAESLREKIIGITRNSAIDYFTDKLLSSVKLQSIDLNKPQINNIRLRGMMVNQDQYDGAILPEPYASEAVARGAKRLNGTEDLKVERLMCVLFRDSIYKARKEDIQKLRLAYDKAVVALNADSSANVLGYFPEKQRIQLPDTLFQYVPMKPSIVFNDSMMNDVREWAKSRELIK